MRIKVRVSMPLSPEDQAQLQKLGCEEKPFIIRGNEALFSASSEYEEQLRAIGCVLSVEPMPVYRIE